MFPTWGSNWASVKGAKVYSIHRTRNSLDDSWANATRINQSFGFLVVTVQSKTTTNARLSTRMAAGLTEGDGGAHLKTFHPIGPGLSSIKLHDASWLDFNMFQSSHASKDHDNGLYVENDYALKPSKPTMDGEPRYEGIPVGFYLRNASGIDRFDDYDSRQAAYWSILAGACGHTYGNNNVWQMYKPDRNNCWRSESCA